MKLDIRKKVTKVFFNIDITYIVPVEHREKSEIRIASKYVVKPLCESRERFGISPKQCFLSLNKKIKSRTVIMN